MIIPKLSLRNLVRNPKSSAALIGLIAAGVFLFDCGEAFLGAAASGLRAEYRDRFTGDLAIRSRFDREFGLFGFTVPLIGEYERIPTLPETPAVRSILESIPGIAMETPVVAGAALLETGRGYQAKVPAFGVESPDYFDFFPALAFSRGSAPRGSAHWVVIPASLARDIEKAEGRRLEIGETLQFAMAVGDSFSIRAVRLSGIVDGSRSGGGEASSVVYVDSTTLRSLLGLALGAEPSSATGAAAPSAESSIEDMFSAPQAVAAPASEGMGVDLAARLLDEGQAPSVAIDPAKGAWHFVLARLEPGTPEPLVSARINAALKEAGIQAEAASWLSVAGMSAGIVYLIKTVFEIGMAVLGAIVALVLANGLAFSVIEQSREIATMRAIGARRGFVGRLFFLQALYLAAVGAFLGSAIASILMAGLGKVGIPISNQYLLMLFGSPVLRPSLSPVSLVAGAVGALIVSALAAAYPVYLAARAGIASTMAAE